MTTENNVAAQAGDEPMRATFEALAVPDGLNVERGFKNGYRDADTRAAYRGFKLAQVSPRATADVERGMKLAPLQLADMHLKYAIEHIDAGLLDRAKLSIATSRRTVQSAQPCVTADVERDAARWQWMRENWFMFGGVAHSRTTVLGMNFHRINVAGDTHTLDVAVDAAIADDT